MNDLKTEKIKKILTIVCLHVVLFFFSLFGTSSKFAAGEVFFSFKFVIYYFIVLLNMGLFAVVWQQFLKKMQLTVAYANKAITIAWTLLWGDILFDEHIGFFQILGMMIIIVGVILVVTSKENGND